VSGPANSFRLFPNASVDPFGDIVVTWYTNQNADGSLTAKNGQGDYLINVDATYSTDGGQTWATPFQVNNANDPFDPDAGAVNRYAGPAATTRIGEYFGIANFGGTAYVAWTGSTRDSMGTATGQQVLFNAFPINGSLTVTGDDGGVTTNDDIVVRQIAGNPGFVEVLVNGQRQYAGLLAALSGGIHVNGVNGDDTLTVDYTNGNPVPAGGISFDGDASVNTLRVVSHVNTWDVTGLNAGDV